MIDPIRPVIAAIREDLAANGNINTEVVVGVGTTTLSSEQIVTVNATGLPLGSEGRIGKWVVNVMAFSPVRSSALWLGFRAFEAIRAAVYAGKIDKATSFEVVTLPSLVENPTSSQAHKAVGFSVAVIGHYHW